MGFLFSIIMVVHNAEDSIDDAIESVVKQDIGFENVQLVLVINESIDKSIEKCSHWKERYPHNIITIRNEGAGKAAARNIGKACAEGKYLNYMTSAGKISSNILSRVYRFFLRYGKETQVVTIAKNCLDVICDDSLHDSEFENESRVIDLNITSFIPQMSCESFYFERKAVEHLSFDTKLYYEDELKYTVMALAEKQKLGILCNRSSFPDSLVTDNPIPTKRRDIRWYTTWFNSFAKDVFRFFHQRETKVPEWVQFVIVVELQKIFFSEYQQAALCLLSKDEIQTVLTLIADTLSFVDDDIICNKMVDQSHRAWLLKLKYQRAEVITRQSEHEIDVYIQNVCVGRLSDTELEIDFIKIKNDTAQIEGAIFLLPDIPVSDYRIKIKNEDESALSRWSFVEARSIKRFDKWIQKAWMFTTTIKLNNQKEYGIHFYLTYCGVEIEFRTLRIGSFLPLSTYKNGTVLENGWKYFIDGNILRLVECKGLIKRIKRELLWEKTLIAVQARKAILYRWFSKIIRILKNKQVWLLSDRIEKADDSSEFLFKYVQQNMSKEVKAFYIISKKSRDYNRLQAYKNVIQYKSIKHKIISLVADVTISTGARDPILNPFGSFSEWNKDILMMIPFVFIEHGFTINEISNWLCRWNQNISGFIVGGESEKAELTNGKYGYCEEDIWLTGLPRFDREYFHSDRKIVTVMPTWRRNVVNNRSEETGLWTLITDFEKTTFYQFYHQLLNHQRLLEYLNQKGYKMCFHLHPNLIVYSRRFAPNSIVDIDSYDVSYKELFSKSSLIVTDYSTAIFDYAYLKKPVVYAQFDQETFYSVQAYQKSTFDYSKQGFGPITTSVEETVSKIMDYIDNDCRMEDEYIERVDAFFAYHDTENCKRAAEKIKAFVDECS